MKLGFISDIHGNETALDAVLTDMPPVDELICLGDIVGYGPRPAECVERIQAEADVVVQGNHDRVVTVDPSRYAGNHAAHKGLQWAKESLSTQQLRWLDSLPEQTVAFDTVRVVHSHPQNTDEYVRPGKFTRMVSHLDDGERVLSMGHTHIQHIVDMRKYDSNGLILNPGSVGQPRDNDPRAAYAVVDLDDLSCDLRRVDYDISQVQDRIQDAGLPEKSGRRLASGT